MDFSQFFRDFLEGMKILKKYAAILQVSSHMELSKWKIIVFIRALIDGLSFEFRLESLFLFVLSGCIFSASCSRLFLVF